MFVAAWLTPVTRDNSSRGPSQDLFRESSGDFGSVYPFRVINEPSHPVWAVRVSILCYKSFSVTILLLPHWPQWPANSELGTGERVWHLMHSEQIEASLHPICSLWGKRQFRPSLFSNCCAVLGRLSGHIVFHRKSLWTLWPRRPSSPRLPGDFLPTSFTSLLQTPARSATSL